MNNTRKMQIAAELIDEVSENVYDDPDLERRIAGMAKTVSHAREDLLRNRLRKLDDAGHFDRKLGGNA